MIYSLKSYVLANWLTAPKHLFYALRQLWMKIFSKFSNIRCLSMPLHFTTIRRLYEHVKSTYGYYVQLFLVRSRIFELTYHETCHEPVLLLINDPARWVVTVLFPALMIIDHCNRIKQCFFPVVLAAVMYRASEFWHVSELRRSADRADQAMCISLHNCPDN